MSIDWGQGLGMLAGAIAAARKRRRDEAYQQAVQAFQLALLPYGGRLDLFAQQNPMGARKAMADYEAAIRGYGAANRYPAMAGFQFPREPIPGPVERPALPAAVVPKTVTEAQSRGAGLDVASQRGAFLAAGSPGQLMPAAPEVRGPSPGDQIALPRVGLLDRTVRDVVTDPARQQQIATRYGPGVLQATLGEALTAFPQLRLDIFGFEVPTFAEAYPSVKWRGNEGNRRMLNIDGTPMNAAQQMAYIREFGTTPNANQTRFETRVNAVTSRLQKARGDLISFVEHNPAMNDQDRAVLEGKVRAFNDSLTAANDALRKDAEDNQFSFGGLTVQPVRADEVALAGAREARAAAHQQFMEQHAREQTRLAAERVKLSQQRLARAEQGPAYSEPVTMTDPNRTTHQLRFMRKRDGSVTPQELIGGQWIDISAARYEDIVGAKLPTKTLTEADRAALRLWRDPSTQNWPQPQREALRKRVVAIMRGLGIDFPDVPETKTQPQGTPGTNRFQRIFDWIINELAPGAAPPQRGATRYRTPRGELTVAEVTKLIQQASERGHATPQQIHDALVQMGIPPQDFGY